MCFLPSKVIGSIYHVKGIHWLYLLKFKTLDLEIRWQLIFASLQPWNCNFQNERTGNSVSEALYKFEGMYFPVVPSPWGSLLLVILSGKMFVGLLLQWLLISEPGKGWLWEKLCLGCGTSWWYWREVRWYRRSWRCEECTKWTCHSSNEETRAFFSWQFATGITSFAGSIACCRIDVDIGNDWNFCSLAKEYCYLGLLELGKPFLQRH